MNRVFTSRECRGAAALIATFCLMSVASAGFIPDSIKVGFTPPGPPPWAGDGPPPFVFELAPNNPQLAFLTIEEEILGIDPLSVEVSGVTTDDPTISLTKEVLNNSGFTWTGYEIDLTGNSMYVAGTASSDMMTLLSETDKKLVFGLPNPVADGETVSFTFDILIPSTGPFDFTLRQLATVPEPGTIALACLATGLLVVTYRRRA